MVLSGNPFRRSEDLRRRNLFFYRSFFVYLLKTTHIKGRLWRGDKALQSGLAAKGWSRFITTGELLSMIKK
jgi:hypothetical protein